MFGQYGEGAPVPLEDFEGVVREVVVEDVEAPIPEHGLRSKKTHVQ